MGDDGTATASELGVVRKEELNEGENRIWVLQFVVHKALLLFVAVVEGISPKLISLCWEDGRNETSKVGLEVTQEACKAVAVATAV